MNEQVEILVAIPARNEAVRIGRCLRGVMSALAVARGSGRVSRSRIAVAAHRCTDATVEIARRELGRRAEDGLVLRLDEDQPVGGVRTRLAMAAAASDPALDPARLWLFSTDADSVVPSDWVLGMLDAAARADADLVAGLVDLVGWRGGRAARRAYRQIIAAKLEPDGGHRHVYAANLAIRWTAFEALGGFPAVANGEEAALLAAARNLGLPVATPSRPRVRTSGRTDGRASDGLAALLARLAQDAV